MWTKVMIFLIVFFIVANPSTFKIMRGVLGSWVASADGLATPAGLILHSLVFAGLATMVPKYLMRSSYYEDEDYEDEEYETLAERQAAVRRKFAHLNVTRKPKMRKAARAGKSNKVAAQAEKSSKAAEIEEPVVDSTPMGGYLVI